MRGMLRGGRRWIGPSGHWRARRTPKISGAHVQISEAKDGFLLTDLNSTNGTTVGDKRLEKGEKVAFSAQTIVRLGPNTTIELEPKR